MSLNDISDPNAVLKAIEEMHELGRTTFLANYGYGPARDYFIFYEGEYYDSKAILGVAHGKQFPKKGPLQPNEFSGGSQTTDKLEKLGFEIFRITANLDSVPATPAYLFTWNPNKWDWYDLDSYVEEVENLGSTLYQWSSGRIRNIPIGSRAYLIRLGKEPKGIIGNGIVQSNPVLGEHWGEGDQCYYLTLQLDHLDPEPLIELSVLRSAPFSSFRGWTPQQSGTRIPDDIAVRLNKLWLQRKGNQPQQQGKEVTDNNSPHISAYPLMSETELAIKNSLQEGTTYEILLNVFKRNPEARKRCIERFGTSCTICGFDFAEHYGDNFGGIIHVHHLVPFSQNSGKRDVDPTRDLRPICPNCHAVIHHSKPPISIEEVRRHIKNAQKR